jgi:hypothetical protein
VRKTITDRIGPSLQHRPRQLPRDLIADFRRQLFELHQRPRRCEPLIFFLRQALTNVETSHRNRSSMISPRNLVQCETETTISNQYPDRNIRANRKVGNTPVLCQPPTSVLMQF